MKITRKDKDSVNSIISISINKKDYSEKVENTLKIIEKKLIYLVLEKVISLWD